MNLYETQGKEITIEMAMVQFIPYNQRNKITHSVLLVIPTDVNFILDISNIKQKLILEVE
jgi:hypothetical protein